MYGKWKAFKYFGTGKTVELASELIRITAEDIAVDGSYVHVRDQLPFETANNLEERKTECENEREEKH